MFPPSAQFLRPNSAIVHNSFISLTLHIQSISKSFRSYLQNVHKAWWFVNTVTSIALVQATIYYLLSWYQQPYTWSTCFQSWSSPCCFLKCNQDDPFTHKSHHTKYLLKILPVKSPQWSSTTSHTGLHSSLPLHIRFRSPWPTENRWWYTTSKMRL